LNCPILLEMLKINEERGSANQDSCARTELRGKGGRTGPTGRSKAPANEVSKEK